MQIIGERAFSAATLPQSIRSVSTNLLMACWSKSDSYALYMRHANDQQRRELCTRSWSAVSVELYFSASKSSLNGQKPTPQLVDQHLKRTDFVADAKANSEISCTTFLPPAILSPCSAERRVLE